MAPRWNFEALAAAHAYAVLDVRLAAGVVVPPHVSGSADVVVQVVEGEVEVVCDRRRDRLTAGEAAFVARGRPRGLEALSDARLLVTGVPGGLDQLAAIVADAELEPDDRAALLAAAGVVRVPSA